MLLLLLLLLVFDSLAFSLKFIDMFKLYLQKKKN
jgi:hypothetical protein